MLMVKKALIYVTGLLFMAFGVAFSVNSSLGVSPVNSLPYVISRITGLDLGNCEKGKDRYPIIHPKFSRDFAFHFAVGYPF